MNLINSQTPTRRNRAGGFTLVEIMVVVALTSILLAMAASMWVAGSRSFVALANYSDLDAKSRNALDRMSREIRESTAVMDFKKRGNRRLTVTNAVAGTTTTYEWDPAARTLVCQKPGQADQVYLTECDSWDFDFFQRAPQRGGSYVFVPATNTAGVFDPSVCKLINMSWKCSRVVVGSQFNTESVQTAQVVLRNKQ